MPQLRKRLRLNLPDALAGDIEMFPHLFERALFAGLIESEAHLDDFLFARRQRRQNILGQLAQIVRDRRFGGIRRPSILDEARDRRFAVIADRRLERYRLLRDLQSLSNFPRRHIDASRQFLMSRLSSKLLNHQSLSSQNLVDDLHHMNGNTNRTTLIGYRSRNRLADPPRCIGRELVAPSPVELFDGSHQADVALLDQVEEMEPAIDIVLGNRDHQAKVCFDHLALRLFDFVVCPRHRLQRALDLGSAGAVLTLDFAEHFASGPLLLLELGYVLLPLRVERSLNSVQSVFRRANATHDSLDRRDESASCSRGKGIGSNSPGEIDQLMSVLSTQPLELL